MMNQRGSQTPPYVTSASSIRQEIQRFESVHPSIYALYDLIEAVSDVLLQHQMREHILCIEDSFVNSQEWTLSRNIPDLKLGILGASNSGKSALVHRYLTGSYMAEESPEGGRFKKEVVLDGQSNLLLIRDEGGAPELQFTHWVDAVILVFSLENELSFNAIYSYYAKMAHYRNIHEIPIILVGTQDAISESNPRLIDDSRARKLAADLKRCSYYETCATYGLNVERVFQDACQKIVQQRPIVQQFVTAPRAPQPSGGGINAAGPASYPAGGGANTAGPSNASSLNLQGHALPSFHDDTSRVTLHDKPEQKPPPTPVEPGFHYGARQAVPVSIPVVPDIGLQKSVSLPDPSLGTQVNTSRDVFIKSATLAASLTPVLSRKQKMTSSNVQKSNSFSGRAFFHHRSSLPPAPDIDEEVVVPPFSTPVLRRKNILSRSFHQKKSEEKINNGESKHSVRSVPTKQGYLYKKSGKPLSKEWKKKYVALTDDGHLTYHPSIDEYTDNTHGKDITLMKTTVKVPGGRPRGSEAPRPSQPGSGSQLTYLPGLTDGTSAPSGDMNGVELSMNGGLSAVKNDTPNIKKRHRRAKSGAKTLDNGADGDSDGYEFTIVSLDNRQWYFEAQTAEEREDWIIAIEQQILSSLQLNESNKSRMHIKNAVTQAAIVNAIKTVKGKKKKVPTATLR